MNIKKTKFIFLFFLLIVPIGCNHPSESNLSESKISKPKISIKCAYNPDSGKANPLGMRAYITITEQEGNTHFLFEKFPSNIAEKITISNQREMIFYQTPLDTARVIMIQNKDYYSELVGYKDPEGFAPINEVLNCK
ncbi:MAG: hypothetical protein F6K10_20035 [Moorea sp. SIO2B7]|nr:hypothetical protein [Moorena sp. SIO2B7]